LLVIQEYDFDIDNFFAVGLDCSIFMTTDLCIPIENTMGWSVVVSHAWE